MKFNLNYNVLENPVVRAICFIISIIFIIMGILTLKSKLGESPLILIIYLSLESQPQVGGQSCFFWLFENSFRVQGMPDLSPRSGESQGQPPARNHP